MGASEQQPIWGRIIYEYTNHYRHINMETIIPKVLLLRLSPGYFGFLDSQTGCRYINNQVFSMFPM